MSIIEESRKLIGLLGGEKNILSLVHCATRLRFQLADDGKADTEEIEKLGFVLSVVNKGGQYQIVIGPLVSKYFEAINDQIDIKKSKEANKKIKKGGAADFVIRCISGSITPLLPAVCGSALIRAILSALVNFGVLAETGSTCLVLTAAANAVFYFLPILVGFTLSQQLNVNPYVGAVIGAALLEPNFQSLIDVPGSTFFGIPLKAIDYGSSLLPIFIIILIYAGLDKFLRKHVPDGIAFFMVPFLEFVILVPLGTIVFGPFGTIISEGIAGVVSYLFSLNTAIAGGILGMFYQILVIFGIHWGLAPICFDALSRTGLDPYEGTGGIASNYGCAGIAFGAYLKAEKHSKMKAVAASCLSSQLLAGVGEPTLYGIVLKHKRLIPTIMIAGGIGGFIAGLFGSAEKAYVLHNVFSLAFMSYTPLHGILIAVIAAFAIATVLTYFWAIPESEMEDYRASHEAVPMAENIVPIMEAGSKAVQELDICSPLEGEVMELEKVEDEIFSKGIVGQGCAVLPQNNVVTAPCDGEVSVLLPSKHAVGIRAQNGSDILIHVGLNTVMNEGNGFRKFVDVGDHVHMGDKLIEFDKEALESKGYDLVTPVIITNEESYHSITLAAKGNVRSGDIIFSIN